MTKSIRYALRQTLPVLFGYLFLGFAFGIALAQAGYTWVWALGISLTVYAGSMQFVLVSLLSSGASLLTAATMTIVINSRHMFYGLSFLSRFRAMGARFPYMVFSLTDETYSLLCAAKYPAGIDANTADFCTALFDQLYWVAGCVLGALAGQLLPIDFTGIDFSMTALFVVLFIEQYKAQTHPLPAFLGLFCALGCLFVFGASHFIVPALCLCALLLCLFRRPIEAGRGERQ